MMVRAHLLAVAVGALLQTPTAERGIVRRVEPSRTALVLVEYQNDFVSPGGKFHDVVKSEIERTAMMRHTADLLARARRAGVPVIHVPYTYSEHYRSQSERVGVLSTIGGAEKIATGAWREPAFAPGLWGASFAAETAPSSGEVVVRGKHGLDAFASAPYR